MNARLLPLLGFALLMGLLGFGLWYIKRHDINEVPSPLIGKAAPEFSLPLLDDPEKTLSGASLRGQPYVLHVFASWCFVCREENPVLMTAGKGLGLKLVGFNYKDEPSDAKLWLRQFGNPYDTIVSDLDGKVGIDLGVYGAPETFLIDGDGVIRHKHIGALTSQAIQEELMPMVDQMRSEAAK